MMAFDRVRIGKAACFECSALCIIADLDMMVRECNDAIYRIPIALVPADEAARAEIQALSAREVRE